MAADVYEVAAPYVTLKVQDDTGAWTVRGFYAGARVPAERVDRASLQHHVDGGMLAAVDEPATVEADPAQQATGDPARPAGNASTDAWLAYAVARRPEGMTEDEAREAYGSKTRAELVAEFG